MFRSYLFTALSLLFCRSVVSGPWTYEKGSSNCNATSSNPCGPAYWGRVSGSSGCLTSQSQTPIDFNGATAVQNQSVVPPTFNIVGGGCNTWVAFTNQYVLEVDYNVAAKNVACTNLYVTWEGVDYTLLQMHFHSPSEHTIGNGRYSAEAHMVHQSAKTGGYLVIGVMLQVDSTNSPADLTADDANEYDDGVNRNNAFLNSIWTAGNKAAKAFVPNSSPNLYVTGSTSVFMNPYKDLTPGSKSMYHYFGGLTTPPCVVPGGVNWWVYDTPVMISANDLYYLRRIVQVKGNYLSNRGDNSRPVQALNGRLVMYIPAVPAAQTTPSTPATTTTTTSSSSSTAEKDTYNTAIALGGVAIAFVGLVVFALLFIFYVLFCQQKK